MLADLLDFLKLLVGRLELLFKFLIGVGLGHKVGVLIGLLHCLPRGKLGMLFDVAEKDVIGRASIAYSSGGIRPINMCGKLDFCNGNSVTNW